MQTELISKITNEKKDQALHTLMHWKECNNTFDTVATVDTW